MPTPSLDNWIVVMVKQESFLEHAMSKKIVFFNSKSIQT